MPHLRAFFHCAPRAAAACAVFAVALGAAPAWSQWIWLDKDGRKVFSDRAPPQEVPAQSILKQPGGRAAASAPTGAASAAAPGVAAAAPAAKASGVDKELEERKKKAEQEEAAKVKAQQESALQVRRENCERARAAVAVLDTGQRIRRPNAQGELEYLNDAQRQQERQRLLDVMSRDCGA